MDAIWAFHRLYKGTHKFLHSGESGYVRLHHRDSRKKSKTFPDQQRMEGVPKNGTACTKAQRYRALRCVWGS